MAHRSLALALLLGVAGCAGADEGAAAAGARRFVETAGTPLYAVAKGAACVVAAVGSLPAAAPTFSARPRPSEPSRRRPRVVTGQV